MGTENSVFVVEDDPASAQLIRLMLEDICPVEVFGRAEECLSRLQDETPGVILLDVGLPGMDGYTFCQQLKQREDIARVPVIFVSGHVEIEARLRGYEVGGHDFIVKPFNVGEVKHKIELLLSGREERSRLESRLEESDLLTTMILSSLDEYAVLLRYLRELNSCEAPMDMVDVTRRMLEGFHLCGAIQLRLQDETVTVASHGDTTPLTVSVLNHVSTMGRIFEFRKHGVYNFDGITLMVDNMPVDDPELCGRLRDHLAIAIETADARLAGLIAAGRNLQVTAAIEKTIGDIQVMVANFASRYDHAKRGGEVIMRDLMDEMRVAFSHLGMTLLQEESLLDLVHQQTAKLVDLYDSGQETQGVLAKLQERMTSMRTVLKTSGK